MKIEWLTNMVRKGVGGGGENGRLIKNHLADPWCEYSVLIMYRDWAFIGGRPLFKAGVYSLNANYGSAASVLAYIIRLSIEK